MDAEDFFNEALGFSELIFTDEDGNEINPKFQADGKQLKIKLIKPKEDFTMFKSDREKADKVVELARKLKMNFVMMVGFKNETEAGTDLFWSCDYGPPQAIGMMEVGICRLLE